MKTSSILDRILSDSNQDHSGRESFDEPKKIVNPLQRMLMESTLDHLLDFLHRSHIQWTLTRGAKGYYVAQIRMEKMVQYNASSAASPKAAMADALAKFLVGEKHDHHEYGWDPKPVPEPTELD